MPPVTTHLPLSCVCAATEEAGLRHCVGPTNNYCSCSGQRAYLPRPTPAPCSCCSSRRTVRHSPTHISSAYLRQTRLEPAAAMKLNQRDVVLRGGETRRGVGLDVGRDVHCGRGAGEEEGEVQWLWRRGGTLPPASGARLLPPTCARLASIRPSPWSLNNGMWFWE